MNDDSDVPRAWVFAAARALAGPGVPWPLLPHNTQESLLTDAFRCLYAVLPHIKQAIREEQPACGYAVQCRPDRS